MKTVSSAEAKNTFGQVIMKAQQEPVCISKNGKPAAVMLSVEEYARIQALREHALHQRLDQALEDVKVGRVVDGPEFMESLRQQYFDGDL